MTNGYDQYLRRTNLSILNSPSSILASTRYAYDTASRLATVSDGVNTAAYGYLANSPLVGNVWFTNNTTLRMTTTKTYDFLNRLTAMTSAAGGSNVVVVNYANNPANQRTSITNVDSSRWVYQYDSLGQVVSGKKYWSDGTPVAGQQFEYSFDDIGNRKNTAAGGDQLGANLRPANYTANSLNQYSSREVPGYMNVLGSAKTNATVTLWSTNSTSLYATTTRKGEYFHGELPLNNSTGAVWLTITNLAVLQNGSNPDIVTNTVGQTFVPRTAENFYYDDDGNLTNDGRWTYTWDAENRLVSMTSLSTAPTASKLKLDFVYDSKGRRIQKLVSTNNGSTYVAQYTNRFVYDGWNLVGILAPNSQLLSAYTWGLDLSGSEQGAGGVGGLLLSRDAAAATTNYVAYDGNGNVMALVNAASGAVTANYEYGPFGEVLRTTGASAKSNPFRFSTKYQDDETDQLYYGYRSYNPSTGRWLSRDPIEEQGGKNIYAFVRNKPVCKFDRDGRVESDPATSCCDSERQREGWSTLLTRFSRAAGFLNSHGVQVDPNDEEGVSCINSANMILAFMSPIPSCWTCYIQRRSWNYIPWVGDENSILCKPNTKCGVPSVPIVFDWFWLRYRETVLNKPTPYYGPILAWEYNAMFPYDIDPPLGARWNKQNPAPHDDCVSKSTWKAENYDYLRTLVPNQ